MELDDVGGLGSSFTRVYRYSELKQYCLHHIIWTKAI